MRASKIGIELGKAELTALLTFAGADNSTSNVYFGVRRAKGKLVASATDGHRALEITTESESDDHVVGEWSVARAFLESCAKILDTEGVCVLLVTRHGLRQARIMDVESLAERATVSWHEEAASTQITMETLTGLIHSAKLQAGHKGSWFALNGRYLSELAIVSKACNKAPITIYPPAAPSAPMYFEATSDGAQWRGCIMPVTVEEPGGRTGDDDEQPDDIGTNRAVRKAVDELRDVLDKNGATLTVHSPTDDGVVDNDYAPDADGAAVPVKAAKKEKAQKVPASAKPKKTKGA